jgi:hypothetical protein
MKPAKADRVAASSSITEIMTSVMKGMDLVVGQFRLLRAFG